MTSHSDKNNTRKTVDQFIDSTEHFVKDTLKHFHLDHLDLKKFNFKFPIDQTPISTTETTEDYVIKVSLPGYQLKDIDIETFNGKLKVVAKTKEPSSTVFSKTFSLPIGTKIDEIEASFSEGQLMILIPKITPPSFS